MPQLQSSLTDLIPEHQTQRIRYLLSLSKRQLSTQQIIEAGRLLIGVEKQLKPRQWGQWTRTNIGQCRRTIQFLKSVARFADGLGDDSCLHSLPRYLLYCLASKKLTKQALEEALEIRRLVGQGALSEQLIEDKVVKE